MNAATIEAGFEPSNWSMIAKFVDSASMMNKALEMIEAHYLFNMPADKIRRYSSAIGHSFDG